MIREWGKEDRDALRLWIGGNFYRAAFLIHHAPMKANTLDRILRGYHDPGALLTARLRDILERYPSGGALPHNSQLLVG